MSRMQPKKTPGTAQMNLLFSDSKPMALPDDRQRELAIALADLLLKAIVEPCVPEPEEQA